MKALVFARTYRAATLVAEAMKLGYDWNWVNESRHIDGISRDTPIYVYDPPRFGLSRHQYLMLVELRHRMFENVRHVTEEEL